MLFVAAFVATLWFSLFSSPSDNRPTDWRDSEPSGRPGRPADRALGDTTCTKRLPLSGQIPDQIQTGGKQRLEGTIALSISEHSSSASTIRTAMPIILITITIFPLPHPLVFVVQIVHAWEPSQLRFSMLKHLQSGAMINYSGSKDNSHVSVEFGVFVLLVWNVISSCSKTAHGFQSSGHGTSPVKL